MYRKTYVEVNVNKLKYNVETLLNNYPDYDYYFGIVKGNAYGHTVKVVKHLIKSGINYLAIASLEEAIEVRDEEIDLPILCLEPIHSNHIKEIIENNITITVSSIKYLNELNSQILPGKIKIHLKVDSGMKRLGFDNKEDFLMAYNIASVNPNLEVEGIFTHFATEGIDDEHWDKQMRNFREITSLVNIKEIPIVHMGRSLTLLAKKKIPFCNGIRLGIIMYGYNYLPKELQKEEYKPAFSLYSEAMEVRTVKKGDTVGYGAKFEALEDIKVAIIPIGYADGFLRTNRNGYAVINGKRFQIIEVNMGMIMIWVDENVNEGDIVTLIGKGITCMEVAERNHTIAYEIICLINNYVPRIVKED